MGLIRRYYPFNAEQTVNILSEFGPLVTMFVVNGLYGIEAGTWALIVSTVLAMVVMRLVLGRLPIFPIIASGVTVVFGAMTIATGDPMWIQIKVTIFNAMFAGFLFGGLWANGGPLAGYAVGAIGAIIGVGFLAQIPYMGAPLQLGSGGSPLATNVISLGASLLGFLMGGLVFRRNFFRYVFEKTFHYTQLGWDRFTFSFAWFFVLTAVLNEVIRQVFVDTELYQVPLLGEMDGVNIWILFKLAFIMPLSGLYAWYLTRLMQKYRIDAPEPEAVPVAAQPATAVAKVGGKRAGGRTWMVVAAMFTFVVVGGGMTYAYKAMHGGHPDKIGIVQPR